MVEKSEIMDDNENYLELSKMNFSPFTTQFANVNVNQFAKFTQNLTTANGQVLSLVSGADGLQFLQTQPQVTTPSTTMTPTQTYITLPITVPGSKPGEAQQTFQIQVLNPNQIPLQQQAPKFQMSQMQIPIHGLQQHGTTVLTVAYSPQDGEMLPNHGQMQDGPVTVLAAIQPQDLQLLAQQNGLAHHQQLHQQQQQQQQQLQQQQQQQQQQQASSTTSESEEGQEKERHRPINIKSEPQFWSHNPVTITAPHNQLTTDLTEYLHARNMNLQPYFKINTDAINIKKELYNDALSLQITDNNNVILNNYNHQLNDTSSSHNNSSLSNNAGDTTNDLSNNEMDDSQSQNEDTVQDMDENEGDKAEVDSNGKVKKKRKMKKKTPKPKRPKPGQVHIATALDGTILFCCPECQMAYPEKESLEQHLVVHKIERRYICDICGAGLKRKEHLERHKLGHNSERPFVCSVCSKGFKRKEHLNLHFVIHSGHKTEICLECGKGFYRKDHLRKHIKSHQTKRMKEANATVSGSSTSKNDNDSVNVKRERFSPINSPHENQTRTTEDDESNNGVTTSSASLPFRCMPQELTFHVGSAQIKLPHLVTTTSADGTSETIVVKMPSNL